MKTTLRKWIHTVSKLTALIPRQSNVGEFFWSWILTDCIQDLKKKKELEKHTELFFAYLNLLFFAVVDAVVVELIKLTNITSLPRSRFLDVTERCVTSKKRLRGRLKHHMIDNVSVLSPGSSDAHLSRKLAQYILRLVRVWFVNRWSICASSHLYISKPAIQSRICGRL